MRRYLTRVRRASRSVVADLRTAARPAVVFVAILSAPLIACQSTTLAPTQPPTPETPPAQEAATADPRALQQEGFEPTPARPPSVETPPPAATPDITVEEVPVLTRPASAAPVKVGLLLPLSGRHAELGRALLDAASMALFDIADDSLVLLPRDTMGTPAGAEAAAASALQEGAELLLGPLFRESVEAVAPLARERDINVIAFSTDRNVAGDGVYLLGFAPNQQVDRVVGYAISQGHSRFAAIVPETPYGLTVVRELESAVARFGGEMYQVEYFAAHGADADDAVKRLARYAGRRQALLDQRQALQARGDAAAQRRLRRLENRDTVGNVGFDAVMLPAGGQLLRSVAPLLPYYDIDVSEIRLLGTGLWDDPAIGRESAMVGAWFAGPPPSAGNVFRQRFETVYGRKPPRIASVAYDAAALAAVLSQTPGGPTFDTNALTNASGFAGNDGIFRFRADGVAERGLAVIQIESDGFGVVDPPPSTFEELTN